jgi:hypothetical protein
MCPLELHHRSKRALHHVLHAPFFSIVSETRSTSCSKPPCVGGRPFEASLATLVTAMIVLDVRRSGQHHGLGVCNAYSFADECRLGHVRISPSTVDILLPKDLFRYHLADTTFLPCVRCKELAVKAHPPSCMLAKAFCWPSSNPV